MKLNLSFYWYFAFNLALLINSKILIRKKKYTQVDLDNELLIICKEPIL